MGLNISGLVIDKNYKDHLEELESILGRKLTRGKEVTFQKALESWKEDTYCDIYFSERGTLVLLAMEAGAFEFYADGQTAFSFVLSEMTAMFTINYVQNGELLRTIMVTDGEVTENEGTPFDFEAEQEDHSELIYQLIEKTLGESFHEIDQEASCTRYTFEESEEEEEDSEDFSESPLRQENKKPWWKFW